MPIKRLMRQTAAFPRIGKLRKGAAKPNDKQPGKDLEYFRFDSDDPYAVQQFETAYGKQPKQINIYLPHETVEENFQTWQEAYVAGGLKHRCDGETCVIWQKPDGTYSQEPKPCPGGCKEVGRLDVIIPELARLAYVTVETHSINDILQLTDNLQAALALRGRLTGIPFVLSRRPQEISTPGKDGKRARYTKYMLFVEPHPDWVRVQLATMRHNALAVAADGLALPEHRQLTDGRTVDVGTGEIVNVQPVAQNGSGFHPNADGLEVEPDFYEESQEDLDAPGDPPSSIEQEAEKLAASWGSPPAAQKWAIEAGLTQNEHSARTRWLEIVKKDFGNQCIPTGRPGANEKAIMRAYALHYLGKQPANSPAAEPAF